MSSEESGLYHCKAGVMLYNEHDPFWNTACKLLTAKRLYITGTNANDLVPLCEFHLQLLSPDATPIPLDDAGLPVCDPAEPNATSPWPHDYEYIDDEYGSLADGGSYEVYRCRRCGRTAYSQLPD